MPLLCHWSVLAVRLFLLIFLFFFPEHVATSSGLISTNCQINMVKNPYNESNYSLVWSTIFFFKVISSGFMSTNVKSLFYATFCTTNVLHKSRIRNAKIIFFFWNEKKREHAFVFYHPKHSIKTPQGSCTYTRQTQLNEYCIYLHSCNVLKIIFSLYCSNVENIFYILSH